MNLSTLLFINVCNYVQHSTSFYVCQKKSINGFIKNLIQRAENRVEPTLKDKVVIAVVDMEREYRRHLKKSEIMSCCLMVWNDTNNSLCIEMTIDLYTCFHDTKYKFAEIIENATINVDDSLLKICHNLIPVSSNRGPKQQPYLSRGMPRKIFYNRGKRIRKTANGSALIPDDLTLHSVYEHVLSVISHNRVAKRTRSTSPITSTIHYETSGFINLSNRSTEKVTQTAVSEVKTPVIAIHELHDTHGASHKYSQPSLSPPHLVSVSSSSINISQHLGGVQPFFSPVIFPPSSWSPPLGFQTYIQPSTVTKEVLPIIKASKTRVVDSSIQPHIFTPTDFSHELHSMLTLQMKPETDQNIIPPDVELQIDQQDISTLYYTTPDILSANFNNEVISKINTGPSKIAANISQVSSNSSASVIKEIVDKLIPQSEEYDYKYDDEYWKRQAERFNYPVI